MAIGKHRRVVGAVLAATLAAAGLSGCEYANPIYPERRTEDSAPTFGGLQRDTVFGPDGIQLFGEKRAKEGEGSGGGIGVNSFLWRASLDTAAFMPIAQADPFGGVIVTDWYAPPETPDERFKLNIFILGRALRADGIRVSVFRQVRQAADWADVAVEPKMATKMEDAILTRARQLRIAASPRS